MRVIAVFLLMFPGFVFGQLPPYLAGKVIYPVFDQFPFMGVLPGDTNILGYDPSIDYKILIDVYQEISDSTQVNAAISEVARLYNLNIANGVPEDKLHIAVITHGKGLNAFFNNEKYQETYGVDNPNIPVLESMKAKGIQIYACAQYMGFWQIANEDMDETVEITLSAKTAIITLDQRGYTYMNVNED